MHASKFVVYAKFFCVIKCFVCLYNILLLSLVYSHPAFFIDWKLFCFFFVYLNLLTWLSRQCLIVTLNMDTFHAVTVIFLSQQRSKILVKNYYIFIKIFTVNTAILIFFWKDGLEIFWEFLGKPKQLSVI